MSDDLIDSALNEAMEEMLDIWECSIRCTEEVDNEQ